MNQPKHTDRTTAGRILLLMLAATIAMVATIGRDLSQDFSMQARQAVFGLQQTQLDIPYSGATPISLPPVLLVAHNAGDQRSTTARALKHHADGIEIDVLEKDGVLYATHSDPLDIIPEEAWQAPRLLKAWQYTSGASVLKLDLKSTSPSALESLVQFITTHQEDRQIIIVSKDVDALAFLSSALPDSLGFLSVGTGRELDIILETRGRIEDVAGISIPESALTARRVEELKAHGYLIDAWTVNDVQRLIELTRLGVDSITTDNVAFFDMIAETPTPSDSPGI